jgi:hypothetical protein
MTDATPGLPSPVSDLQSALRADPVGFPFSVELSLAPLIAFWTRAAADWQSAKGRIARSVLDEIQKAPELAETIADVAVIERHRDLVDVLMSAAFPASAWDTEYGAAMTPFQMHGFYATPSFRRLLMGEDGKLRGHVNLDDRMVGVMRLAFAYAVVLQRLYGIALDVDYPLVLTVPDPDTGLDRHFRLLFDWRFVDVMALGEVPPLAEAVRRRLHASILDAALLREVLPPENLLLRGVTIERAVEVTDQEVVSALKRDLIERDSVVSDTRFAKLQNRVRTLLRRPELILKLAVIEGDRVLVLNHGARHERACLFGDSTHHHMSEFAGSIYEKAILTGQPVIIDDLTTVEPRTVVEERLVQGGTRSLLTAPLRYQDRTIGSLMLSAALPGQLDTTHLPKLQEVLPLFSMAVQRSMEELNARIQTEIKERFTAIHPAVEWRFRKAVLDGIERGAEGLELAPIVFPNVYPLYALSDIRGSSTERARAIQADLLAQLRLARQVVQAAHHTRPLPALAELLYRIDKHAGQVRELLASGDEVSVISFLRSDVESLFDHLATFGAGVRERIEAYRAALHPQSGALHHERQRFEDSVTRIIETISAYVDRAEATAQAMFPHYFEKQNTDGVDHQIYVGASLVEGGRFDPLYLKSLRLWQLMVMCGIAVRADRLTPSLPLPLRTTHLILVQHSTISMRFRFDEKRFGIDGAYDVRYEIVKKRIDKALIKGTDERLTQPGKIALVYSQPAEAFEYRDYIEYLQHLGYLTADVEDLALEDLQGVHGLHALRVTVAADLREEALTHDATRALQTSQP